MAVDLAALTEIIGIERRTAETLDRDVLLGVEKARRDLDAVEQAIKRGERVPSSVSGDVFVVASTVRDLVRTISARQASYEVVARFERLAEGERDDRVRA